MRTVLEMAARSVLGLVVLGTLLFLPAGTLGYWQAWLFLAVFTLSTAVPSIYLMRTNPAAIQRRMRAGQEDRPAQRVVIALLFLLFLALLVFSALDHRLGWSPVSPVVSLIGAVLLALGLVLAMLVVIQNSFTAGNITVESNQQVISTGFYGLVRHPMYTCALIAIVGMPLSLDSWWGIGFVVPMAVLLAFRIRDEEKLLEQELDGYRDYMRKTRYRLVPYIW